MSENKLQELYRVPGLIQSTILEDMEARITGGKPIIDGNGVMFFLLDQFGSIASDFSNEILNEFESQYESRAQNPEHLYKHMSDYDYVGIFSTPAGSYLELILGKDQLIENAISFNENYSKVIIPRNTLFKISQYSFGIHYPIEIKINKNTNTFIISYDTSVDNPLQNLVQNTLEHRIANYKGLEQISILIPVEQFTRVEIEEDVVINASFVKRYSFEDNFYAIRVFTDVDGERVELKQSLSDTVYDPANVTAVISVDMESNLVTVTIPQVYLNQGMVGNQVFVELYSSKGSVDIDTSSITQEQISATFTQTGDPTIDKYIAPITRPETLIVNVTGSKIVGGSEGISFEELRRRTIGNNFHGDVLIGPTELENHFKDNGFRVKKYLDNITDRIYLCYRHLTDSNGIVLPSASIPVTISNTILENTSTITDNGEGSYTILPKTVYKFNRSSNTSTILSDEELTLLSAMNKVDMVNHFNNTTYLRSPYHVRVDTSAGVPTAYSYDFTTPTINSIEFISDNINISTQLTVFTGNIEHNVFEENGFVLTLTVAKTEDLKDVDPSDIVINLSTRAHSGSLVYQEAQYVETIADKLIYEIRFESDFSITRDHVISIDTLRDYFETTGHRIPLNSKFGMSFFLRSSLLDESSLSSTNVGAHISTLYPEFTPVADQEIDITFGTYLDSIFTNVDVLYSDKEYVRHEVDVYSTYAEDVFDRDGDGNLKYEIVDDNVNLEILHHAGDIIRSEYTVALTAENISSYYDSVDTADDTVISVVNAADFIGQTKTLLVPNVKFAKGTAVLDANGQPIISSDREIIYNTDILQIDMKFTLSEDVDNVDMFRDLTDILRSYYSAIDSSKPNLIEETKIFFQPMRTIGNAQFKQSETSKIDLDLELTIALKLHVYPFVMNSTTIQETIRDTIATIVDEDIDTGQLSLTDISRRIKTAMADYIEFVDVLGINGMHDLQTVIPIDDTTVPTLKQELYIRDDGSIALRRAVDVVFIPTKV